MVATTSRILLRLYTAMLLRLVLAFWRFVSTLRPSATKRIGDGHAVLITRTLQPHGDEAPLAIDILQVHAQNPVSASNRTPIADALTRARQQHQNRFIAIRTSAVDQFLNRFGLQDFRKRARNTATESIALSLARRQVAPNHPVTQLFGERVPRGRVDEMLPDFGRGTRLAASLNGEKKAFSFSPGWSEDEAPRI
jgi:hypothetical protein